MQIAAQSEITHLRSSRTRRLRSPRLIRLGYVQLSDAAPFIVADSLGLFAKYDLHVTLSRELGWATVRDKLAYGELDAAQALSPLPIASHLGMGIPHPCDCLATMVLNTNGNAITLGTHLRDIGIQTDRDLARLRPTNHRYTLGVVSLYSTHHILLRIWLKQIGLNPDRDVRIVVIPPAQMLRNLEARTLDGYCVGEPWNGAAVHRGSGWIAQTSQTLAPNHPEKVLLTRRDYSSFSSLECIHLIAALLDACEYCQSQDTRRKIVQQLAEKRYLDCPTGWLEYGFGLQSENSMAPRPELPLNTVSFYGAGINCPSATQYQWVLEGMRLCNLIDSTKPCPATGSELWTDTYFAEAEKVRH